jgi:outer membrane receptor protein involved in Fe transport
MTTADAGAIGANLHFPQSRKAHALATSSVTAIVAGLLWAQAAQAQTTATADASPATKASDVEVITVTGSHIITQGYEAPTPVSVLSTKDLESLAEPNIADAVNRLPSIQGSAKPQTAQDSFSSGSGGVNQLNLRDIGTARTLVLLDGRRVVGATLGASVDVNVIPSALVSRVDVVTGGASAAYGSDALAGVINFILDKDYSGVKGTIEGGVSTYGDNKLYTVSLTAGTPFAGDRGHFLISGEHSHTQGIPEAADRPWFSGDAFNFMVNPLYGTGPGQTTSVPQYIARDHYAVSTATPGGLITAGPLKGTQFLQGGTPAPFQYGSIFSSPGMSGGDWQTSRFDATEMLGVTIQRETLFARGSYDITDSLQVFSELQWATTRTVNSPGLYYYRLGNITIKNDNAFIPASIRTSMAALGLTNFTMGTWNSDCCRAQANVGRTFRRAMGGVKGKFDALDTSWSWDASFGRSSTHISARVPNATNVPRYNEAIDAVVNPATGQIVCRSTLTNPNNGCVPYDVMGLGVNSDAARAYITGTSYSMQVLTQEVMNANVTGSPFSSWAGPVSIAAGAEHRMESVTGFVTANDAQSLWSFGNFKATIGKYYVTEGYVETVVPLAKDTNWAKSLELNAAVRATDYSVSGYVTTWKVGATYSPIDDITFRSTRSRDIRAPNLSDLYNAGAPGTTVVTDHFRNEAVTTFISAVEGNTKLVPEKADSTGFGVVLQPTFLPGFGASVDYYNIDINGAITSVSAQEYMDRCYAGETALCSFIDRLPPAPGEQYGVINYIHRRPANILSQEARGIDFEASQNLPLSLVDSDWGGSLQFRALATRVLKSTSNDRGVVQDGAGVIYVINGGFPLSANKLRYTGSIAYTNDVFTGTFTVRGFGSGVYSTTAVVCTSGCPVSTLNNPTYDFNHINAVQFYDLTLNYKVIDNVETFFVVENLFNTAPPVVAGNLSAGFATGAAGANAYDRTGRNFRAGVRFKM